MISRYLRNRTQALRTNKIRPASFKEPERREKMKTKKSVNVRKLAIVGVLGAISVVLGMTPLGFIPVGPTRATIMHIPVIIGAIVEGPIVGALVGLIFGLFSIYQSVTAPTPVSFVFLNPLVSVLPRVLIGLTAYYSYKGLSTLGRKKTIWLLNIIWIVIVAYLIKGISEVITTNQGILALIMNIGLLIVTFGMFYLTNWKMKEKPLDIAASAIIGTLTNTLGVLTMIYILYAERFVEAIGQNKDMARRVIMGIGVANGIPEAIIAVIVVTGVVGALIKKRK